MNIKSGPSIKKLIIFSGLIALPSWSFAQGNVDNSSVNVRDRSSFEKTADQQNSSKKDLEVIRSIRRLIMKDKSMSMYAQNVKIISDNGLVTLKGPVKNNAEIERIRKHADDVAGTANVIDEMEVVSQ